jgi:hypothetical protein
MRRGLAVAAVAVAALGVSLTGQNRPHLNPMVDLLKDGKAVFGLSAPPARAGGAGGNRGRGAAGTPETPPPPPAPPRTPLERAREALAHPEADYFFDGGMERGVDGALPGFIAFADALVEAGGISRSPFHRLLAPLSVKTPKVSTDPAKYWGLTEAEYRARADVWPLNPDGELVAWAIVESREGLANVREIAQVKGLGVLIPGAGTLGGIFSTTNAEGRRVRDDAAWEAANQQVLAACKEFKVACGYPANASDIEMRMKQGFSVFVMQWGEQGFKAIDIGRKASNRATN